MVAGVQTTEGLVDNERPIGVSVVQGSPLDISVLQEPPLDNFVDDNSVIQGKASQNNLLDMTSQHDFVHNLIKNPTLISQFTKADPEAVNTIIDLLVDILEVSRNLSAGLANDVNDALIAKTAAEASWTTMVREKADAKTAAEAAYSTLASQNAVKKASVDGESEAIIRAIALVRRILTAGVPSHNETGYRLFKMPAVSGFTDNTAGMTKYIAICHAAGYLPVGCGRDNGNLHCNSATRYKDNDCVEITGFCNVQSQIGTMTGWTPIITFQSTPATNSLYSSVGNPSASSTFFPVCGIRV